MKTQDTALVDYFAAAREQFESTVAQLGALAAENWTHSTIEELLKTQGNETFRLVYQGHLDALSQSDLLCAQARARLDGERVHAVTRPLESLFGRVHLLRCSTAIASGMGRYFPLDRSLNLPREHYSLPVRQRVAEAARSIAMEPTVEAIDRGTGAHVPKRQAEQLVVRAAQDFDAFYEQRTQVANDVLTNKALRVMTSDGH